MAYTPIPPSEYYATLSAAATNVTLSSMNGDQEISYFLEGELFIAQANVAVTFLPNSQSANLIGAHGDRITGFTTDAMAGTSWAIARNATAPFLFASGAKVYFWGFLRAKTGRIRGINLNVLCTGAVNAFNAGFSRDIFDLMGTWTETTTPLSTFQVLSSVASGFDTGSWVRASRMPVSN